MMYNNQEEELVNRVKKLRRFFDQKVRPMPKQSLTAMKVAFGVRAQYATIALVMTIFVTQFIGVVIFSGRASAVGTISYSSSITSRANQDNRSFDKDSDGNIYVADPRNQLIRKYDATGQFVVEWGEPGTGSGQFGSDSPARIAVDSSNNVYALDNANNRVQKFNSSGVFQSQFGSSGTADGQFDLSLATCQGYCGGIDTDSSGNVYVADAGNFRVQKFNSSGAHQSTWGSAGSGAGQFGLMRDLGVSPAGDIYVAGGPTSINNRTQKFSSTGVYSTFLTASTTNTPGGIDFDDSGNVYIADTSQDRFYKYNSSGTFVSWTRNITNGAAFTNDVIWEDTDNFYTVDYPAAFVAVPSIKKVDSSNTKLFMFSNTNTAVLNNSSAVAVGPDGSRYVASSGSQSIQKYSSTGQFLQMWSNPTGVGLDAFTAPYGIAVDKNNNVFVLDVGSYRVIKFDSDGNYITRWGSLGTGNGQFGNTFGTRPSGITVDRAGNVYVADTGNNRIQKFGNTGTYLDQWGTLGTGDTQFSEVRGVAADNYGHIYTVEAGSNRVKKYDTGGNFISKWGSSGSGNGQFSRAYAITTDASGRVYVGDATARRIQKFDADGTYVTKWGSSGSGNGQFNFSDSNFVSSLGLATDADNKVYVADTGNRRVQIFDDASFDLRLTTETVQGTTPNEAYLRLRSSDLAGISSPSYSFEYGATTSYGSTASPDYDEVGLLSSTTIAPPSGWTGFSFEPWVGKRDSQGSYYVSKIASPTCQLVKFDASNNYQHTLGTTCAGNSPTNLPLVPVAYDVDSHDNVYVAIEQTGYIQKYDSTGNYTGYIDTGYSSDSFRIAVDRQDNLYVALRQSAKILKYDSSGNLVDQWGSVGTGDGQFSGGSAYNDVIQLQIDPSDRVYTLNHSRIQYFSSTGDYIGQWSVSDAAPFFIDTAGTVYVGSSTFPYSAYTAYDLAGNMLSNFDINPPDSFGVFLKVDYPAGNFQTISSSSLDTRRTLVRRAYGTASGLTCGTTYHYRAKAVANGDTVYGADQTFTTDACLDITTATLLDGTVGSSYSDLVETNRSDVTITLDSGSLPPGLSLAGGGAITGTPATSGTYNFTVLATDNGNNETNSQALQIVVGETPPEPFSITTTSLPDGLVDTGYSQALSTDSSSPVSFSVQSGSLPAGLSLSSEGVISGTPTNAGVASFVVIATNGATSDTQSLSVTVTEPTTDGGGGTVDPEPDPAIDPSPPTDEVPADELPDITDVTPTTTPVTKQTKPTSIASPQTVIAAQNSLFALAKRIPEPFAVGFPWILLLLALLLVGIQYYQVHAESVATKRLQAALGNQERLVEEQNNFVALTTHYLHTPLTVMEGEIALMVKAGTLSDAQATKLKATLASLNAEAEALLTQEEQHESSN